MHPKLTCVPMPACARRWVQQAVFRSVAFQSRMIRLPVHVHNLLNRARAVRKALYLESGAAPTDDQVAARMKLPLKKLKMLDDASRGTYSSSAPLKSVTKKGSGAGDRRSMGLSIESEMAAGTEGSDSSEDFVEGELFHASMAEVLAVLDDDERFVLSLRYGLGVPRRLTMQQIADMAGSSKMWVKKMEQKALRKLRRPHHQMKLRAFSTDRHVLEDAVAEQERKKLLAEAKFAADAADKEDAPLAAGTLDPLAGEEGGAGVEGSLAGWQAAALFELQAAIRQGREEDSRGLAASDRPGGEAPGGAASAGARRSSLAAAADVFAEAAAAAGGPGSSAEEVGALEAMAAAFLGRAR